MLDLILPCIHSSLAREQIDCVSRSAFSNNSGKLAKLATGGIRSAQYPAARRGRRATCL